MLKKLRISANRWVSNKKNNYSKRVNSKKLTMCKKCFTFYYKNSWHFDRPRDVSLDNDIEIPVRFTDCAACLEEESSVLENESGLAWGI